MDGGHQPFSPSLRDSVPNHLLVLGRRRGDCAIAPCVQGSYRTVKQMSLMSHGHRNPHKGLSLIVPGSSSQQRFLIACSNRIIRSKLSLAQRTRAQQGIKEENCPPDHASFISREKPQWGSLGEIPPTQRRVADSITPGQFSRVDMLRNPSVDLWPCSCSFPVPSNYEEPRVNSQ